MRDTGSVCRFLKLLERFGAGGDRANRHGSKDLAQSRRLRTTGAMLAGDWGLARDILHDRTINSDAIAGEVDV